MFKRILVPVDLTEPDFAKPAIDTAVEMVRASGGIVRVVNVLPKSTVKVSLPPWPETSTRSVGRVRRSDGGRGTPFTDSKTCPELAPLPPWTDPLMVAPASFPSAPTIAPE